MTERESKSARDILTPAEIAAWGPASSPQSDKSAPLRSALERHGLSGPLQAAGHHFAMGCVALEVTQRCNLDCSACYLSDLSESVRDIPRSELLRRVDAIADHYGPYTNVQVTGGDPTLRPIDDLIAVVERIAAHRMRPALFTNGIKASREMLARLAKAGLRDVAFHVDLTQERKGYDTEASLNALREEYLERARGLGLQVLFNTTVFNGNVDEVAALAKFFRDRARDVHLASFQLVADTGRGVERARGASISREAIAAEISRGAGAALSFDAPLVGHPDCNGYAMILAAGEATAPVVAASDRRFMERLFVAGRDLFADRHRPAAAAISFARWIAARPRLALSAAAFGARKAWALRRGLFADRPSRITFYIHNFMHAEALERDRCETCVFMTMTRDGPVSMCVHNAKRDAFILQPVDRSDDGSVAGDHDRRRDVIDVSALPIKRLKGRVRAERMQERRRAS